MAYGNALELIGNTPIVEVGCFDTGMCRLYLKLESQNPGGSIKDRVGLSMIEAAEREGKIRPGDTLVEATAGNTGLGLALAAARKGYRLVLVIPDKMSQQKVLHLRALGAQIVMTRSDVEKGHPAYYQDYAARLASEMPGAYHVNQFNNPANPRAHETTTGPELWQQMQGHIDAVVVGVGSGGTLSGLTRFFKRVHPGVEMVLADPTGSILADYVGSGKLGRAGSWLVEGIGEDFVPAQCDFDLVKRAYSVTDQESFDTARTLLRREGILAGSSSGTLIAAAVKYCQEQTSAKQVVTFVGDTGNKYLSKMFDDAWMQDNGFVPVQKTGTVLDLVGRRYRDGAVVTLSPQDTIQIAYQRMKLYDISQLPVVEEGQVVGLIDESDVLQVVTAAGESAFQSTVSSHMTRQLESVGADAPIDAVLPILRRGLVALVKDTETFTGL